MLGSEFVARYAHAPFQTWEKAALDLGREEGGLCPWPWVPLELESAAGDKATLQIQSDVLAVGTPEDHLRLPLTPGGAQAILNDSVLYPGALLPTPWLVYQIWRASKAKLTPTPMVPNQGANLAQYAAHSSAIDEQLRSADSGSRDLVAGHKKSVVVSNVYRPGTVLIFGWYRPPPAPDVYDDGTAMTNPQRQPIQPLSYAHSDGYVDYSHGIRAVHPTAIVNGDEMSTEALYRHPTFSALVSHEGPIRVTRYPSTVAPVAYRPGMALAGQGLADLGLASIVSILRRLWA